MALYSLTTGHRVAGPAADTLPMSGVDGAVSWSYTQLHRLRRAQALADRRDAAIRWAYFAIGFAPITTLAMAIVGIVPLPVSTILIVLPAILVAVGLFVQYPEHGTRFATGLGIGLLATAAYDTVRWTTIALGMWGDFIPKIGGMLLARPEPNWLVGYLWRYLGNGAGMGAAFVMVLPLVSARAACAKAAPIYGVAIWLCLIGTLVVAPDGQAMLFNLTPATLALSLLGHLVYGITLGRLMLLLRYRL
jgi:hypothetical protein